jgi:hypothetical protein
MISGFQADFSAALNTANLARAIAPGRSPDITQQIVESLETTIATQLSMRHPNWEPSLNGPVLIAATVAEDQLYLLPDTVSLLKISTSTQSLKGTSDCA